MRKNKNGFISMTLVYTFLVIFLFLMLAILNTYIQKDKYLEAINTIIDEDIAKSQGIKSTLLGKILEENTPSQMSHYNQINIANWAFSNGNGLFYSDNLSVNDENSDGEAKRIYFFRGRVESNHVRFANLCWRIVRTNEDGSIRIMYNGPVDTTTGASPCKTVDQMTATGSTYTRSIGKVQFNTSTNNQKNVLYVDGEVADATNAHSPIKDKLEDWYRKNILEVTVGGEVISYANRVSPAIYCNDRRFSAKVNIIPTYSNDQSHNIYDVTNFKNEVSLKCTRSTDESNKYDDRYNVVSSINGNQLLTYPIGLITAPEVALAGGYLTSDDDVYQGGVNGMVNEGYYMFTKNNYWTMTPFDYEGGVAKVVYVDNQGVMRGAAVNNSYDIIPVITLRANVGVASGVGSAEDPFVIR